MNYLKPLFLLLLLPSNVLAEPVILCEQPPSVAQMVAIVEGYDNHCGNKANLANNSTALSGYNMRSIRKKSAKSTADNTANNKTPTAFALMINFKLNSTEVVQQSQPYLTNLGELLSLERYKNKTFTIEGHADASGNAVYNQQLSQQRADFIKNYLVSHYSINAHRLNTIGFGENQPLANYNPYDAKNRRVQIKW